MSLSAAFAVLIVTSFIINLSASVVIKGLVKLGKKYSISDFSMGFFVLGLATSLPEFFVGINAVINGQPQLSLGNLIGAQIVLLSFIIGTTAIVARNIEFENSFGKRDILLTSFVILSPAFLLIDQRLTRYDGILLVILYIVFFLALNRGETLGEHIRHTFTLHGNHLSKTTLKLFMGFAGLVVSAFFLVRAAESLAANLNLPLVLIGLLFLAIGTNLPELTVMLKASRLKHNHLAIGDFLGSAAANSPVLGILAIIHPIHIVAPVKVFFSLGMLFITLVTFNAFYMSEKRLSRLEGISLVLLYVFFIYLEFFLKTTG